MELVYFVVQQLQSFVGELVYLVWGRVLSQAGIKKKPYNFPFVCYRKSILILTIRSFLLRARIRRCRPFPSATPRTTVFQNFGKASYAVKIIFFRT